MVAQTGAMPDHPAPAAQENRSDEDTFGEDAFHRRANRGGLRRTVASIARLVDIQYRIWLTEAKMAVARIVMYVVLFGAAALLGILGIIFLFIGAFHVLTDVIGLVPVWAYLIFAVVQLGLALALVMMAKSKLSTPDAPNPDGVK